MRVIAKKGNGFGCAAFNHASNQGNHKIIFQIIGCPAFKSPAALPLRI